MLDELLKTEGPERETLLERVVGIIPLKYPWAALVWSLALGSPGFHLAEYLDRGTSSFSTGPANLAVDFLFFLVPFYLYIVVRYMRMKIVSAESEITPVLPEGRKLTTGNLAGLRKRCPS